MNFALTWIFIELIVLSNNNELQNTLYATLALSLSPDILSDTLYNFNSLFPLYNTTIDKSKKNVK